MAVRSREEMIQLANGIIGESTTDEALAFLEDLTDTLGNNDVDWRQKYEENDAAWRKRYRDRFSGVVETVESVPDDTPSPADPDEKETITIDDLFEEE